MTCITVVAIMAIRLLAEPVMFQLQALPWARGRLGSLCCRVTVNSFRVVCQVQSEPESAALQPANCPAAACFSIRRQCHIAHSKPCFAADLGFREIQVEARAGDVMAGGARRGPRRTSDTSRQVTHLSSARDYAIIPRRTGLWYPCS